MAKFEPIVIVPASQVRKDDKLLGMHTWSQGDANPALVLRATRNGNDRKTRKITFFRNLDPIVLENDTLVAIVRGS